MKINRDTAATLLGLGMAILNAIVTVDWQTFQLDWRHIVPLLVSVGIAVGAWLSKFKKIDINNGTETNS